MYSLFHRPAARLSAIASHVGFSSSTTNIMAPAIPTLKLNDGHSLPVLAYGLGTANYKGPGKAPFDQKIVDYTVTAVDVGFHHLDGAEVYGNEEELGAAVKAVLAKGDVKREQLYVVTKYNPKPEAEGTVEAAFSESLKKLGVDYVDLYLIHSPFWKGSDEDDYAALQRRWAEVEKIQASGRAKSIGVSNYIQPHLEATLKTAKVKPAINQIEFHPYLQHGDLVAFHKKHGIALSAYAPLTAVTKASPGPLDDTYAELAKKYSVTPADIALRWVIDQDIVAITTSSKRDRLEGYLKNVLSFQLTPDEVATISTIGQKKHFRGFWNHIYGPDDRR